MARTDGKKNKRKVTSAKITKTSVVSRPANGDPTDPMFKSEDGMPDEKLCKQFDRMKLRRMRDEKGVTNAQLASAAGIDESTVSSILSGDIKMPPENRVKGFAKVLGVSMESLMKEDAVSIDPQELAKQVAAELDGDSFSKEVVEATIQTALEKQSGEIDGIKEELEKQRMVGNMNEMMMNMPEKERRMMMKMPEDKRKAYYMASPEKRREMMDMYKSQDESIEINGQTMMKSEVGDAVFAMMKAQAEEVAAMKKAQAEALEKAKDQEFMVKAQTEYKHLPGAENVAKMLKSLDGLSEEEQKPFLQMMKAKDGFVADSLLAKGSGGAGSDAENTFESLVKSRMNKEGLTKAQATAKVMDTREGTIAYNEMIQEN